MRDPCVGDMLDQYRLTDLLARGGMASIFKAVDADSGQAVVLKIPHIQYESDVVFFERFRREEEIGQRLDHPGIVKVLTPRAKSRMYMAMEYVEGTTLHAVLQARRPLPAPEALDIARQICGALVCLHGHGVVHRDLKPENVLVTEGGQVKILDFGIALLEAARRLTWAGLSHAVGTPDYMAPEQIRGKRGDARTDVYALGTMLYEMLTGSLPYESATSIALLSAKAGEDPRPPSAIVPGFDPSLEAVILKAIERAPGDRHAGAAELLAELRDPSSVASRDPVSTGRSPRRGRGGIGRGRALLAALAAVLAGLGLLTWLSQSTPAGPRQRPPGAPADVTRTGSAR